MKKLFILCLLAIGIFHDKKISAQDLPKIVHPSPEASALFRFQDYPMDHSTGLPQISIPIYEVRSGSLSVPISISYHASGRRVSDQDGPVAVGWSLNAGGSISRTIYGSADFGAPVIGTHHFPYPFVTENLTNLDNLEYLEKIIHYDNESANVHPWKDSEYDVFSYSLGNSSGKFIFKDVNAVKTPVLLPDKPYIIEPTYTWWGLDEIKITDDNGILYHFVTGETYSESSNSAVSGWRITKIISADKTDTISFTYTGKGQQRTTISQSAVLIDAWTMQFEPFPTDNLTYHETTTQENYSTSRLAAIEFKQGKVIFNLVSGNDKIDNIQILNINNEVLKTIQLERSLCYSQSELGYATHKLDALVFKDKASTAIETYTFEYYPVISSNGQINVRYCDWWGYYNNSGVHDFVPRYTNLQYIGSGGPGTINVGNPSANRNPSLEPLKSGVLKKITYPTGGTTEFIYEKNRCTLNGGGGTPIDGPGLRIYQIKSTDETGIPLVKTYKYGVNESGYGSIELLPDITSMASEVKYGYISLPSFTPERSGAYRQRTFLSGFIGELSELANRPVIYTEVTEYHGTVTSNTGKTVYKYDYAPWAASGMPALTSLTIPKKHIYNFNYWNTPSLLSKTDYKRLENGSSVTYQEVKKLTNVYTTTTTENVKGLHVQRVYHMPQTGVGADDINPNNTWHSEEYVVNTGWGNPFPVVPVQIYTFSNYQIPAGYKNLTGTTETHYNDDNSTVNNIVSYQYNSKQLVSKTTTNTSEGASIVTDIKYPFDYTGNSLLDQMESLNMLNYPVEQIETKNSVHRKSVRTTYKNWGTTPARIAPQVIEVKNGTGVYESRLRYHSYDNSGNVLTVSKEEDQLISYIWGYNNSYPIAEVINAAVKNIFHTSFEDAEGNSAIDDSKTGKKSRTNGYSKSLSNLTDGNYILTYWQKSGGVWTLQSSTVAVSAGAYTISLSGQVDEVRFYPTDAQMTTFNYEPLIGMTSQCDVNNRITYFEYDGSGRLALVRDQNGNVVKRICYNYAGQSEDCTYYYNTELSQTFQRNNCSSGSTGGTIIYTVPANKYGSAISQADANAKAQADIDAYGQGYANENATCTINSGCFRCTGASKKCINNWCETGIKVYTDSYYDAPNNQTVCVYHYEWSDGSWSVNYYETYPGGGTPCIIQ